MMTSAPTRATRRRRCQAITVPPPWRPRGTRRRGEADVLAGREGARRATFREGDAAVGPRGRERARVSSTGTRPARRLGRGPGFGDGVAGVLLRSSRQRRRPGGPTRGTTSAKRRHRLRHITGLLRLSVDRGTGGIAQDEPAPVLRFDRHRLGHQAFLDIDDDAVVAGVEGAQILGREDGNPRDLTDRFAVGSGPEVLVEERRGRLATARPDREHQRAATIALRPFDDARRRGGAGHSQMLPLRAEKCR